MVTGSGVGRWGRYVGLGRLAPGLLKKVALVERLVALAKECHGVPPGPPPARPGNG